MDTRNIQIVQKLHNSQRGKNYGQNCKRML